MPIYRTPELFVSLFLRELISIRGPGSATGSPQVFCIGGLAVPAEPHPPEEEGERAEELPELPALARVLHFVQGLDWSSKFF